MAAKVQKAKVVVKPVDKIDPAYRFIHLRYTDDENNDEIVPRGGASICYKLEEGNIQCTVAWCHHNDNFNRKRGARIAYGRHQKSPEYHTVIPYPASTEDRYNLSEYIVTKLVQQAEPEDSYDYLRDMTIVYRHHKQQFVSVVPPALPPPTPAIVEAEAPASVTILS